jgi:hypothetical protein
MTGSEVFEFYPRPAAKSTANIETIRPMSSYMSASLGRANPKLRAFRPVSEFLDAQLVELPDAGMRNTPDRIPIGRFGRPDEVADGCGDACAQRLHHRPIHQRKWRSLSNVLDVGAWSNAVTFRSILLSLPLDQQCAGCHLASRF